MDFLAAEFDEGFFVGAIAKDFCFLTVGPSYNNMTEIPRFFLTNHIIERHLVT